MASPRLRHDELVVPANFVRAVRDSGYLSLSTAIAELIDNALQASASRIAITVARPQGHAHPEITVEDNGCGMSVTELELCLRFGGSTRFTDRASLGRFGMGLPAASLSQCRRVQVSAWRDGGPEHSVLLDVDEVVAGGVPSFKASRGSANTVDSGCRVRWSNCDRIEYERLGWLQRALHRDLGRMFRRFLNSRGVELTVNGAVVQPTDWLLTDTMLNGATAEAPFEPLEYAFDVRGHRHAVVARFSVLPVRWWHQIDNRTKRRVGIVGGGGVSILRAGREVALGWHLMGGKRKENYDDWWRCEIEFDPALDELFGVTINKQGIRPTESLRDVLEPQLESAARLLNVRVRESFEEARFRAEADVACRVAREADKDLPVLSEMLRHSPIAYSIETKPLVGRDMFEWSASSGELVLTLNTDHPSFAALYQPLRDLDGDRSRELRTAVELLLLAFVRSAVQVGSMPSTRELVAAWSHTLERMLRAS